MTRKKRTSNNLENHAPGAFANTPERGTLAHRQPRPPRWLALPFVVRVTICIALLAILLLTFFIPVGNARAAKAQVNDEYERSNPSPQSKRVDHSQTDRARLLEALSKVESVESYRVSPDGNWVAVITVSQIPHFPAERATMMYGSYRGRLRIISTSTGEAQLVGLESEDVQNPEWSPDSQRLAYVAGSGDAARLAIWSRAASSVKVIASAVPQTVPRSLNAVPVWLQDGRTVVVATLPVGVSSDSIQRRISGEDSFVDDDDPTKAKSGIRIFNSPSAPDKDASKAGSHGPAAPSTAEFATLDLYATDLAFIDVMSDKIRSRISGKRVVNYHLSPDGKNLLLIDLVGSINGSAYRLRHNIYILDVFSGKLKTVASNISSNGFPIDATWSPDGRHIAFFDSGMDAKHDLTIVDTRSGASRRVGGAIHSVLLSAENANRSDPPAWTSPKEAFAVVDVGLTKSLWRISLNDSRIESVQVKLDSAREVLNVRSTKPSNFSGVAKLLVHTRDKGSLDEGFGLIDPESNAIHMLFEEPASLGTSTSRMNASNSMLETNSDGRTVVFVKQQIDSPQQLWATGTEFKNPRRISEFSRELGKCRFGKGRVVSWVGADGQKLQGAVLLPVDYVPGRRVPLVVQIYGGKRLSLMMNTFGLAGPSPFTLPYDNMQLLSTNGYAVLFADTVARVGSPMIDIAQSLMPGVDRVVDVGIADHDRMGIMGHSYGGYSVLSVLVQTGRFKAAVVSAGFSNLIGSYSDMSADGTAWRIGWVEESQGRMGGSLWQHRNRFIDNSPLFVMDRIATPILLIHGTADSVVQLHEANEVFLSLRRLGKTVQYVQYAGEGHNMVGSENIVDRSERIARSFDKFIRPSQDGADGRATVH